MKIDLSGKVSIVTGGARGIGKEISNTLASCGSKIVIFDVLDEGIDTASDIQKKYNVDAVFMKVDITNLNQIEDLVLKIEEKFGRIDNLINNAAITRDNLFLRMKEEEFDKVISVNLKGAFNCSKAVFKNMISKRSGCIVNISSVIGLMGNIGQVNYAASKAGLIGMTKSIAREGAKRGIRVNAIAPGYINTEMTGVLREKEQEKFLSVIPMGRMGETSDVANVVLFLVSDLSSYITGQVIKVDGGMIM